MTVTNFSVATRFLQTAVIVDDEAYEPFDIDDAFIEAASMEGETIEQFVADFEESHAGPAEVEPSGVPSSSLELVARPRALFTEDVVEGFADFGIACAVLKPAARGGDARDHARLKSLARRADVVVLDWQLNGPDVNGADVGLRESDGTSLSFLRELLLDDVSNGARLRLVCIYTGDPALDEILSRVGRELETVMDTSVTVDQSGLTVLAGSVKVVLVAKLRIGVAGVSPAVRARDLPALVVEQFEQLASTGLLPDIALSALSAVRDNAHHLLERFDSRLDPALISHFCRTGADATGDFVQGLLADEFRSVLSNAGPMDLLDAASISDRVNKRLDAHGPSYYVATKRKGGSDFKLDRDQAEHIFGASVGPGKFSIPPDNKELDPPSLTSILLPTDDLVNLRRTALLIDQRLSVLSCMARTPSTVGTNLPPMLQLGSILVTEELTASSHVDRASNGPSLEAKRKFWLCLQPLCDSVRLVFPTSFPLLPLQVDHAEATDIIVEYGGEMVGLTTFGVKFNQLEMARFDPDGTTKTVRAGKASSKASDPWLFLDASGRPYTWVGQVRQWKAQKLASGVALRASRIGLDEYEFLRLLGPRADQ